VKNLLKILIPIAAVITALSLLPGLYPFVEEGDFKGDYRIPYSLGEDYFLFEKYCANTSSRDVIPVLGDSVIWGHYVHGGSTFTAGLNAMSGTPGFMNLGIDGIHPAAMYGLVNNFCRSIKNRRVIVGINLLWMSSPRHDLSGEVNSSINHGGLLPQFGGAIPAWDPPMEERLTLVVRRDIPFFLWAGHVRAAMLAGGNFYAWTMENPRVSPLAYFSGEKGQFVPSDPVQPERMVPRDMNWVGPGESVQWRYMLETVRLLKARGNRVLAVITPYNSFMLTEKSLLARDNMIGLMAAVLREEGIVTLAPVLDKREYFADLSHPGAEGYRLMAGYCMGNAAFIEFIR